MKQILSCDWLQFHGEHLGFVAGVVDKGTNYVVKHCGHGTRVFRDVFQVWEKASITTSHRNELMATLCVNPHSEIIKHNTFICKIENKVLYQKSPLLRISSMLQQLNLEYKGITRVDICCDLCSFANGWLPLELLRRYRRNDVVKAGSRRYSQWMTAPYSISTMPNIYTDDVRSEEHVCHCVSWGSPNSDVHVKMYNKTKEIAEESHKSYIKSYWRNNELEITGDVWRVEFSISRRSKYLYDNGSDMVVPITLEMVLKQFYLRECFSAMAARHFAFYELNRGGTKKDKKSAKLFEFEDCSAMSCASPQSVPTAGRTAKVCANYLEQLARTTDFDGLLPNKPYNKEIIEAAHDILCSLHDGLKALNLPIASDISASREELRRKAEWLMQWNVLPDIVGGKRWYELDEWYTKVELKNMMLEEMALRRKELECHLQAMSFDE